MLLILEVIQLLLFHFLKFSFSQVIQILKRETEDNEVETIKWLEEFDFFCLNVDLNRQNMEE